jgi:hypothetical protein
MNERLHSKATLVTQSSSTSVRKRLGLQRSFSGESTLSEMLAPVKPASRSLGLRLDPETGPFTRPRSGHDFNQIAIHSRVPREIQPKLKDTKLTPPAATAYEQEADRVATEVTRVPQPKGGSSDQAEGNNQTIESPVQRKIAVGESLAIRQGLDPQTQSHRSDQPLSSQERAFFEPRVGHDFSRVRIHADARSAEMADALNAEAFTVGHNIYFGPGKLLPGTRESDRLLAHELTHVVQQSHTGPALQPKLKMTGKAGYVSRAIALLNGGLGSFYFVSVDKSGQVSLTPNLPAIRSSATGADAQQQALANRLDIIIKDSKDVIITISAGSTTLVGSYATGDIDIDDVEKIGVHALIHEIEEQHQKQAKSLGYGSETTGAHGEGIKAESEVFGAKRGAQKIISSTANVDGTLDAVIEVPFTFPDGKVKTQEMTIKSNNVVSVKWK